jgi:hypothetical protein
MPQLKPVAFALTAIASLMPCASHAVHVSRSGTGQVLIFPYYVARPATPGSEGEKNTLISIVNTTGQFKIVKVRILEGRNGRELRDLNLFLSNHDTWTAAIIPTATGARLVTTDNSCVSPRDSFGRAGADNFSNASYSGTFADGDGSSAVNASLDRTREGYIEVIEMGVVTTVQIQGYIKQGTNGIPANCAALDAMDPGIVANGSPITQFPGSYLGGYLAPPTGGLLGRATLINPALGLNFTYAATALDAWSDNVRYGPSGSGQPRLSAASPAVSTVTLPNGDLLRQTWASGRDAVSAALMKQSVNNEFILDSGTASQTDWIVTFPTRRDYIGVATGPTAPAPQPPFSNNFGGAGACDETAAGNDNYQIYNREGSPLATGTTPLRLCWMTNAIPFGGSSLLQANLLATQPASMLSALAGSNTVGGAATSTPGVSQGANGRMVLRFGTAAQRLTPLSTLLNGQPSANRTLLGLPLISLAVHSYRRSGVISTYGGVIEPIYQAGAVQ